MREPTYWLAGNADDATFATLFALLGTGQPEEKNHPPLYIQICDGTLPQQELRLAALVKQIQIFKESKAISIDLPVVLTLSPEQKHTRDVETHVYATSFPTQEEACKFFAEMNTSNKDKLAALNIFVESSAKSAFQKFHDEGYALHSSCTIVCATSLQNLIYNLTQASITSAFSKKATLLTTAQAFHNLAIASREALKLVNRFGKVVVFQNKDFISGNFLLPNTTAVDEATLTSPEITLSPACISPKHFPRLIHLLTNSKHPAIQSLFRMCIIANLDLLSVMHNWYQAHQQQLLDYPRLGKLLVQTHDAYKSMVCAIAQSSDECEDHIKALLSLESTIPNVQAQLQALKHKAQPNSCERALLLAVTHTMRVLENPASHLTLKYLHMSMYVLGQDFLHSALSQARLCVKKDGRLAFLSVKEGRTKAHLVWLTQHVRVEQVKSYLRSLEVCLTRILTHVSHTSMQRLSNLSRHAFLYSGDLAPRIASPRPKIIEGDSSTAELQTLPQGSEVMRRR